MITIKSIAIEEVDAWVECEHEGIAPENEYLCPNCNGAGGKWHDAVRMAELLGTEPNIYWIGQPVKAYVTKTSKLTRTHEVCGECKGSKKIPGYHNFGGRFSYSVKEDGILDCPDCLKDSNGKPTGCEPNTASEWEGGVVNILHGHYPCGMLMVL